MIHGEEEESGRDASRSCLRLVCLALMWLLQLHTIITARPSFSHRFDIISTLLMQMDKVKQFSCSWCGNIILLFKSSANTPNWVISIVIHYKGPPRHHSSSFGYPPSFMHINSACHKWSQTAQIMILSLISFTLPSTPERGLVNPFIFSPENSAKKVSSQISVTQT